MNTALWICQAFLALTFLYSGVMKSSKSREHLVRIGQTGVDGLSYPTICFIDIIEILGAIGIIIPRATIILPILTPITAIGFAIIMILALRVHYKRREFKAVGINVVLFCISVFVAYSRFCQLKH